MIEGRCLEVLLYLGPVCLREFGWVEGLETEYIYTFVDSCLTWVGVGGLEGAYTESPRTGIDRC